MTQEEAGPGVRFPPPLIYLSGLAAGFALDRWWFAMPLGRPYLKKVATLNLIRTSYCH